VDPVLYWLDVCGVAVFAASGALTASRKQMDLVGFVLSTAVAMIRFFAAPPSRIAISRPAVGRCHRLGGVLRKRR
jgi:Glycine transporter